MNKKLMALYGGIGLFLNLLFSVHVIQAQVIDDPFAYYKMDDYAPDTAVSDDGQGTAT